MAIIKNKIIDHYRKYKTTLSLDALQEIETDNDDPFFDHNGHWKITAKPQNWDVDKKLGNTQHSRILQAWIKKLPQLWSAIFVMQHIGDNQLDAFTSFSRISDFKYE